MNIIVFELYFPHFHVLNKRIKGTVKVAALLNNKFITFLSHATN